MSIKSYIDKILEKFSRRSSESFIKYLRTKGISVGHGCVFRSPFTAYIDLMRPSLITIGNDVDMNKNFTIMSHDFSHKVFLPLYGEFLSSSGAVTIGNNIYFGTNVTILKGVTIGDNCIIGAGSIVTKSIPANSVAVGIPAKVVCSVDDYYEKRKKEYEDEAIAYANAIRIREHREPTLKDFQPEFGLYVDKDNIENYDISPIKARLKDKYEEWFIHHEKVFNGFDDFLEKSRERLKIKE